MPEDTLEPEAPLAQPLPHQWKRLALPLVGLLAGAVVAVLLVYQFVAGRPLDLREASNDAALALEEVLLSNRVPREKIQKTETVRETTDAHWYFCDYVVQLPEGLSPEGLEQVIEKAMRRRDVSVLDATEGGVQEGLNLAIGGHVFARVELQAHDKDMPRLAIIVDDGGHSGDTESGAQEGLDLAIGGHVFARVELQAHDKDMPRLAIIVDDGGHGGDTTEAILALDPALTLSILPFSRYGTETAERAGALGFEVMLHMPMENANTQEPEEGQLATFMSEEEIHTLTYRALAQVPAAVGVNNHEGSKFTASPKAMALFLDGVLARSLFFVDSRTTPDSKAYDLAIAFGIPAANNNIFLDDADDTATIPERFREAVGIAKKRGQAVAIGHFRPETAAKLAELLPSLAEQGVRLVHVSELVE